MAYLYRENQRGRPPATAHHVQFSAGRPRPLAIIKLYIFNIHIHTIDGLSDDCRDFYSELVIHEYSIYV